MTSPYLQAYDKHVLQLTLNEYRWNISKTAQALHITRQTLRMKIREYRLSKLTQPETNYAALGF